MQAATPAADFDARLARLEGFVEQMGVRLTSLESRMDTGFHDVHQRMDSAFRDVHRRMDSGFRWIIGIQFTTLVALGTLILVKL